MFEQQRLATIRLLGHAIGNFGNLEVHTDRLRDAYEFPGAIYRLDEFGKSVECHWLQCRCCADMNGSNTQGEALEADVHESR